MNRTNQRKSSLELSRMSDREFIAYKRALRMRRERNHKLMMLFFALLATVGLILICSVAYGSLKTKANDGFKYYTSVVVESGDTLWSIADEYIDYDHYKNKNVYLAEVQKMNRLDDEMSIQEGQCLILPYYSSEFVY